MTEKMTADEALEILQSPRSWAFKAKAAEFIRAELEALRKDAERYREQLEQAHMAGQSDAGVDPSYSNAQLYVDAALEADNG